MASRGYAPLTAILATVCLAVSSAVVQEPQTSRRDYNGYSLDKGPVFYEAYYGKTAGYPNRGAVLETSFQVPVDRFAHTAESANRPGVANGESSEVAYLSEQRRREGTEFGRAYRAADEFAPGRGDPRRSALLGEDGSLRAANVDEISKLVRRAISRDLENWNALERYLDRVDREVPAPYLEESRANVASDVYSSPTGRLGPGEISREEARADAAPRPVYFGDGGENDARAAGNALPSENIFQPRPQIVRYKFYRRAAARPEERATTDGTATTPRNYGDNLIRGEIVGDGRGELTEKSDVQVTSIQVSELPHKTRHRHGEWPKRRYPDHRRRSPDATSNTEK